MMMMLPSRINRKQMNRDTVRFPIQALVTWGYGSRARTSSTRDQTTACMLSETSNAQKRGERERERSHEHRSDNDLHKTRLHKIPETFYSQSWTHSGTDFQMCSCMCSVLVLNCISDSRVSGFTATLIWDSQGSSNLKEVGYSKAWPSSKSLSIRGTKENIQQQEKEKEKNMWQMITELHSSLSRHMLTVFTILVNFQLSWNERLIFSAKNMLQSMHKHLQIVAVRSWHVRSPKSNLQPLSIDSSKFWNASISWPPPFLGTRDFCLPLHSSCPQPWWPNPSDDPNTLGTLPTASNLYYIYPSNLFYKKPLH
jgi:hypothetical protein